MAGEFYTLGKRKRVKQLEVMAFGRRLHERIANHKRNRKTMTQMVLIVASVIAPFALLAILSEQILKHPVLYVALAMVSTAYFMVFVIANRHLWENKK